MTSTEYRTALDALREETIGYGPTKEKWEAFQLNSGTPNR